MEDVQLEDCKDVKEQWQVEVAKVPWPHLRFSYFSCFILLYCDSIRFEFGYAMILVPFSPLDLFLP